MSDADSTRPGAMRLLALFAAGLMLLASATAAQAWPVAPLPTAPRHTAPRTVRSAASEDQTG